MLDKKLLFDRLRLEGAKLLCFPEYHSLVDGTHAAIQKKHTVYELTGVADFYFNKVSGREIDNADWNFNDEIKNLIPLDEAFFIEFTPPEKKDLPFQAGVMFIAVNVTDLLDRYGSQITAEYRIEARGELERESIKHAQLGEDYCWWNLTSRLLGTDAPLGYQLAFWEMKREVVRWWINALPFMKPESATPVAAPLLCWHMAITPDGKILSTEKRGWVISLQPMSDLVPTAMLSEVERFLRSVILQPALLGWSIINDPRTKMTRRVRFEYRQKMTVSNQYPAPDYLKIKEESVTGDLKDSFFPDILD